MKKKVALRRLAKGLLQQRAQCKHDHYASPKEKNTWHRRCQIGAGEEKTNKCLCSVHCKVKRICNKKK